MKRSISLVCICLAMCLLYSESVNAQSRQVTASRIGNRIDVTVGDHFFTSYRFYDDEKYPFFFPVNSPYQVVVLRLCAMVFILTIRHFSLVVTW